MQSLNLELQQEPCNQSSDAWQRVEARKIMAAIHGIEAIQGKIVHHKDRNPWNNDLSNLEIVSKTEHAAKHKGVPRVVENNTIMVRNVPGEVRRSLKILAAQQSRTLRDLMLELMVRYIDEQKEDSDE